MRRPLPPLDWGPLAPGTSPIRFSSRILSEPHANDEISRKLFSGVYEHELLHVWDYVDIVSQWITSKLRNDQLISRYLIKAEPYQYGRPTDNPTLVRQEFLRFIGDRVVETIFNLYAEEANRRQRQRDAPAEYRAFADKVQTLPSARTIPSSRRR
jgi:hypothetical protein